MKIILPMYLDLANFISFKEDVNLYRDKILTLMESRGLIFTIKYVKTSRNCIMRYLGGDPLESVPGVAVKEGWPVWLDFLKPYSETVTGIKVLTTLLTLLRAMSCEPTLDISTIVEPWKGTDDITISELLRAFQRLNIRQGQVGTWKFPHMSTKRGPQGQAILSSLSELTLMPHELLENILLIGGPSLRKLIEENTEGLDVLEAVAPKGFRATTPGYFTISHWWNWLFPTKSKTIRKIAYFSDKEAKTRVIAILDYWSQSALRPLHIYVNKVLRHIGPDMTFDQNGFTNNTRAPQQGHCYHSIDLTAATDRMPIALQKRVVELLFNSKEKANAWANILVSVSYNLPGSKDTVKYMAGQPMGAYSSWPIMALTHHIIVQVAAERAGLLPSMRASKAYSGYILLGDDLRIDDDRVAEAYKKLISTLGMPYSPEKTHSCTYMFEFAKRWFYKGEEITGFSIGGLLSVYKSYPQLANFLDNQATHGWTLAKESHPDLILSLQKVVRGNAFIYEKAYRMIKLYAVFKEMSQLRHQRGYEEVILSLSKYFALDFHAPVSTSNEVYSVEDIIKLMYLEAKKNLVEKDLYTFQTEAYKINKKLYSFVYDRIKEAGVDQATSQFLVETLSTILNWNNPIVLCLNRLIDQSTSFLMNYWDPDVSSDFLFNEGLSKYHLTKGVFSMRNSVSIMLAESAILKEFITVYKINSLKGYEIITENGFPKLNKISKE
nr:RNA-dependent RNA polymerase [Armillaria borealis mitovirus 1]